MRVFSATAEMVESASSMSRETRSISATRAALESGARGVVYGRNVWQADDPVAMCGFLRDVIHRPQAVLT